MTTRTIYLDSDWNCHTSQPAGTYRELETDFFDGKCDAYVEGYCYVPEGEHWTRADGEVFQGEMVAPWKPYEELAAAQMQYEAMLPEILDMRRALSTMGVSVDG